MLRKLFSTLTLLVLLITSSCSSEGDKEKIKKSKTLSLAYQSNIRSLHPRIGNDFPSSLFISMLFEGLMRKTPHGEIEPGLAYSYDVSEDKCTYTFHLKKTKWSNGDYVTAHDFEHSWKSSVHPDTARTASMCFYVIKNAAACLERKVGIEEVGIKAIDDFTLQVQLENPAPYFLSLTTCAAFAPVHQRNEEAHPDWYNKEGLQFVCNGPYLIDHWHKGSSISFKKSPYYWDRENVDVEVVKALRIEDESVQFQMFKNKELDFIGNPFSKLSADLLIESGLKNSLKCVDTTKVEWLFVNVTKPPFNDKNLRKALAYSINREALAEHVYRLGEKPATGILAATLKLNDKDYFAGVSDEKAKEYFKKALESHGGALGNLTLSFAASGMSKQIVQAIQSQWKQTLGCDVSILQQDWSVQFQNCVKGDYDLAKMGWVSWIDDPIYVLQTFRKKDLNTNMSRWYQKEYEQLLDLSDKEKDVSQRKAYLKQAEAILMEELPIIPIIFGPAIYLHQDYVSNVAISSLMEINIRSIKLDRKGKKAALL